MTNREYLNNMPDEEFAKSLMYGFLCYRCAYVTKTGHCKIKAIGNQMCAVGIAEWLKAKHSDDDN